MSERILDELLETMNKIIDDRGMREDFEKFKKANEGKSLETLLDELKETIMETAILKPEFKILIETNEDEEGYHAHIEGSKASLMLGLAELTTNLVKDSNLTEDDIRGAIETGIKTAKKEE